MALISYRTLAERACGRLVQNRVVDRGTSQKINTAAFAMNTPEQDSPYISSRKLAKSQAGHNWRWSFAPLVRQWEGFHGSL